MRRPRAPSGRGYRYIRLHAVTYRYIPLHTVFRRRLAEARVGRVGLRPGAREQAHARGERRGAAAHLRRGQSHTRWFDTGCPVGDAVVVYTGHRR